MTYLDALNPAQRSAVEFGISQVGTAPCPPLLVIAGAGTGKTMTIAHRVAHLILNGADPRRILLLTFGRRMAAEMIRRVEHICTQAAGSGSRQSWAASVPVEWSGTFHAVGARLLRLHADSIGLDPAFSILDRGDAADLMDMVRDELGLSDQVEGRFPKKATCLGIYSYAVNAQCGVSEALIRAFEWCVGWESALQRLFGAYVAAKQAQGVLDYDDLLLYWAQAMQVPELAALIGERFDHILVDEYQDTNVLQAQILLGLRPDGAGLTVVGDDAQSIYSFRSATVRNILDFPGHFDPPATIVTLEENYRSSPPILDACNRIIAQASERFSKTLYSTKADGHKPLLAVVADETAQVRFVVQRILANREEGMALKDQAVLFRASQHSSQLELELTRLRIPFVKFGGLKFLEASHVKDVVSLLRWAQNPRDRVAGFRVLNLLPGIGPATARRALAHLEAQGGAFGALAGFRPPTTAASSWPGLVETMQDIAGAGWSGQLDRLRCWYDPIVTALYEDARARLADLDQLQRIAAQQPSRVRFLTELALDPPEATGDESGIPIKDEDWLTLSTIHSAKGQEWRAVFVLNLVDGCIPSDLATGTPAAIEEERRLLYVAMSRARDDLVLMQPQRFYVHGQRRFGDAYVSAPRSRFITKADLDAFQIVGDPVSGDLASGGMLKPVPRVDLAARVRVMWG